MDRRTLGKRAVVQFTRGHRQTQAFYLEQHGEPHFVYEFLSVLEDTYDCVSDAVPARFAQLVGNFIGGRHELYYWQKGEELLEDNGVYFVDVLRRPWHVKRLIPPLPLNHSMLYDIMTEAQAQAERESARVHPANEGGKLRREIRAKNDRYFLGALAATSNSPTRGQVKFPHLTTTG